MEIQVMRDKYPSLTKNQRHIVEYMLSHVLDMSYMSLKEAAAHTGVSEVSVLNLCAALGFGSYTALREAFRREVARIYTRGLHLLPDQPGDSPAAPQGQAEYLCGLQLDNWLACMEALDPEVLYTCARSLLRARNVFIFGHDASRIPAEYLAHRLNFFQIRSIAIKPGDVDEVRSLLASVSSGDHVVFFSFLPYYTPVAKIAGFVRMQGASVITITDSMDSPAVVKGGHTFLCRTHLPYNFNGLSAPMAIIEVLVCCIAREMGKKMEDIIHDIYQVEQYIGGYDEPAPSRQKPGHPEGGPGQPAFPIRPQ